MGRNTLVRWAWGLLVVGATACYSSYEHRSPQASARSAQPATQRPPKPKAKPPRAKPEVEKDAQSYRRAWELICQAEAMAGIAPGASRLEREKAVTRWIIGQLKNKQARYWFIGLGQVEKPERLQHFRDEAARAGLASCPVERLLFPAGRP